MFTKSKSRIVALLCSFDQSSGWRIRHVIQAVTSQPPRVVTVDGVKYLRIVSTDKHGKGHFCNPKRLVMKHFHWKQDMLKIINRIGRPVLPGKQNPPILLFEGKASHTVKTEQRSLSNELSMLSRCRRQHQFPYLSL